MALRCVVVEGQVMFLQLLVAMLRTHPNLEVVAAAQGVEEAIAACSEHNPDLLILDLALPDGAGGGVQGRQPPQRDPHRHPARGPQGGHLPGHHRPQAGRSGAGAGLSP